MKIKKFDAINVVPFIDIMLVLLVIVLTTATFVAKGVIPVNLPNAKSATASNKDDKFLTITINQSQEVFFNEDKVLEDDYLKYLLKFDKKTNVKINCDKNVKFELFVKLVDLLKSNDFNKLSILTLKEE